MVSEYARRFYRLLIPFLYRRTRLRLFLAESIESVGHRARELVALTDYFSGSVRPIPVQAPFGNSMLVMAPHQDDETIGCGGALALQVDAKKPACVVLLHDGADGHEALRINREELVATRNEESRQAAAAIGMEAPVFLSYRSLQQSQREAVAKVRDLILARKVDAVFTPFLLDNHPDHKATNAILAGALLEIPWDVRIFGYEVWGLVIPNVIVIIDSVIEKKLASLECFRFANSAIDYTHSTKGLNMYRSRLLGAGECRYAECFFELPKQEFIDLQAILSSTRPEEPGL